MTGELCTSRVPRGRGENGCRRKTASPLSILAVAAACGSLLSAAPPARGAGTSGDDQPLPTLFAIPKLDSKTTDKLDDLDRYIDKKDWELAIRAINSIEADAKGMAPAPDKDKQNGFFFPVAARLKISMLRLPPEGRDAYRLFNDATAKTLWERVQVAKSPSFPTPADELPTLRKIVEQYFLTSIGDLAADRLADACFEQGDFTAAEQLWRGIATDFPNTALSLPKIQVKRCLALSHLEGREEQLATLVNSIKMQYAGQRISIAGEDVDAGDFAAALLQSPASQPAPTVEASSAPAPAISLPQSDDPAWQIHVTRPDAIQQMENQISNMGYGVDVHFLGCTPTAAVDGKHLYVNWLGIVYAADLDTGKMLWRTSKFTDVIPQGQMFKQCGINPDDYAISTYAGKVYALHVDPSKLQRGQATLGLDCLDGQTGKILWSDKGIGSVLAGPVIDRGVGYFLSIVDDEMQLVAVEPNTGKKQWQIDLGKPQGTMNPWGGKNMYATPTLIAANGMIYVATNNGVLTTVDPISHRIDWEYQHVTRPGEGERIFYGGEQTSRLFQTPVSLCVHDDALYLKDEASHMLYALDPQEPELKWRRLVSPEEMIAGVTDHTLYLIGQDVSAIDLNTRQLLWDTKIPVSTGLIQPLVTPDHLFVASQRGIYDIDPANGEVRRIFRGADRNSSGGRLLLAGGKLISVTDAAVTAYPLAGASVAAGQK